MMQLMLKNDQDTLAVIIILKKQTDFEKISDYDFKDQQARIQFVHDELIKQTSEQTSLAQFLTNKRIKFKQFYIMNMIAIKEASADLIEDLANRDDVAKIVADGTVKLKRPPAENLDSPDEPSIQSNIVAIGADKVWNELNIRGENIVIASQDTGVQWDHPALIKKYRGKNKDNVNHDYSWHDSIHEPINKQPNKCGYNLEKPCDDDQHGTHTMGTMLGSDKGNHIGVAPNAKWISCRNMDSGIGSPSTFLECFEFFLAPYPINGSATDGNTAKAPHIINNSWTCPKDEGCSGEEFIHVLNTLKAAGIMVIASAGNEGPRCGTIEASPAANSGKTFSVGALDHRNMKMASFSSRGPSLFDNQFGPDIVAPGVNIRSSVPGSKYEQKNWSGTSMAGPHIAGVVALMWSANPKLIGKIDLTKKILEQTADVGIQTKQSCGGIDPSETPNNIYGYGFVNAYKAVQKALELRQ